VSRSRKLKVVGAAVAALAVAGGGAAIAATKPWSPEEQSQAVLDDAAKQLGVTPSALSDALKNALENRVDEAVADGLLTKEQGAELKKRIESSDVPFPGGPFGYGKPFGFDHGLVLPGPFAKFEAAASYLGLTESELESRLARGKTLAQIAKDRGKSVDGLVDALVKAAEKQIDDAVDAGKITKSQADDLRSGLRDRLTRLVNGETLEFHRFRMPAPGFDFRGPDFAPARPWSGRDFWPRGRSA
jgi:polyhydroxyalkanoate synthesis regulator phasin